MKVKTKRTYKAMASLAALLAVIEMTGCDKGGTSVENNKNSPLVSAIETELAEPTQKIVLSGQIKARHETALGFRVAGKIATRNVDAGQTVKPGDVLYTLDDTDYNLQVNAMRAQETAAKAVLDNAAQEFSRHERMLEKQLVSQAQFDRVQHSYAEAKAGYESVVSGRKNVENNSRYTKLVADSAAIVSEIYADAGQVVSAGTPVLMLSQTNDIEAEAYIPEKYISALSMGDAVTIHVPSANDSDSEGTLREIAGMADPNTRTYRARICFKKAPATLRLGMSADVTISVPLPRYGVLVPPDALCCDDNSSIHVWVVDKNNFTELREIHPDGVQNGMFVVSGINPGEKVVIDGARFLTEPIKVRIAENEASAGSKN